MKTLINKWKELSSLKRLTIIFAIMGLAEIIAYIITGHFFGVSLPLLFNIKY